MAWYDDYFDENYFLLEEPTNLETLAHISFLKSFLDMPAPASILDLACGSGRISIVLSRLNYAVTGLDYKQHLVEHARRCAGDQSGAEFVQGDMRALPFEEKFDLVISFGHSFGYFDEDENSRVLREILKALKKGGRFLLDLANRESLLREFESHSNRWVFKDEAHIFFRREFDPLTGRLDSHIHLAREGVPPRSYTTSIRYYAYPEIKKMLIDEGFKILEIYGGYDKSVYTMRSPRMIILAQKD